MNLRDLLDREQEFWEWAKNRHCGDAVELAKEFLKMSDDSKMNEWAMQAQAASQAAARNIDAMRYQDPNDGISGVLKRERETENEACAVLAESHGFPELARHIRMRVSTSAIPEKK